LRGCSWFFHSSCHNCFCLWTVYHSFFHPSVRW
jgi:hypothetical protein